MTNLRGHLLGGSVLAAAFLGIGKGVQAPAPRNEPKLTAPKLSSKDDDLDDDDDALDDDNEGEDAPDDADTDDEAAAKRNRRRARKAKRVKAEKKAKEDKTEGDDDEAEMRGNSPAAQARARERSRCAAIFADPAAADNLEMAAHLAFNTKLTRAEAIATLAQAPKAKSGLAQAMNGYADHRPGPGAPAPDANKVAAAGWDKALGNRRAKSA